MKKSGANHGGPVIIYHLGDGVGGGGGLGGFWLCHDNFTQCSHKALKYFHDTPPPPIPPPLPSLEVNCHSIFSSPSRTPSLQRLIPPPFPLNPYDPPKIFIPPFSPSPTRH